MRPRCIWHSTAGSVLAIQRTDKWISFPDLRLCVSIELCSKSRMDGRPLSAFCRYDFRPGNVRSLNKVWGFLFSHVADMLHSGFSVELISWSFTHTCKTNRYYLPVASIADSSTTMFCLGSQGPHGSFPSLTFRLSGSRTYYKQNYLIIHKCSFMTNTTVFTRGNHVYKISHNAMNLLLLFLFVLYIYTYIFTFTFHRDSGCDVDSGIDWIILFLCKSILF